MRHVTDIQTIHLNEFDEEKDEEEVTVLEVKKQRKKKNSIPPEYRNKWAKGFLKRTACGNGRVSVALYLKGLRGGPQTPTLKLTRCILL